MNQEQSSIFQIVCGCCGAKIDIDAKSRTVFHIEKEGLKKRSFEQVVEDVTAVTRTAEQKFAQGLDKEKQRKAQLEALFDKAHEKAKLDPRERPPSIFDRD
ncbi:MAG: hypothetical protein ACKVX7_11890 [Planctomycetota bacterium]